MALELYLCASGNFSLSDVNFNSPLTLRRVKSGKSSSPAAQEFMRRGQIIWSGQSFRGRLESPEKRHKRLRIRPAGKFLRHDILMMRQRPPPPADAGSDQDIARLRTKVGQAIGIARPSKAKSIRGDPQAAQERDKGQQRKAIPPALSVDDTEKVLSIDKIWELK